MEPLLQLATQTYMIEHNPNCPKPYLVRLVSPGRACLDRRSPHLMTEDILGYGETLTEAATNAINNQMTARITVRENTSARAH